MQAQYEKITSTGTSIFCRAVDVPAFTAPWHFHPEIELTLITASRGQRFVGDSIAPFAAGDLVLLGANLPHCWINSPRTSRKRSERSRAVIVQFPETLVGQLTELERVRALLVSRATRGLCFRGPSVVCTGRRVEDLPRKHGLERLLELLAILGDLSRIPARQAQPLASEGFVPAHNVTQAGRLERVCRFIARRFSQPIRQEEVAALAHLTPSAFSRFFHRRMGKPFVDYVNDVRIGEACRLLIENDALNVAEICFACGFGNLSNFHRNFTRRHGIAPRDYRRRYTELKR